MVPSLFEARNGLKFEIHCGIGFCHFKLFSVSTICKFKNSKFSLIQMAWKIGFSPRLNNRNTTQILFQL